MGANKGLIRACKYSMPANMLGYCGACNFSELFKDYLEKPSETKEKEVVQALQTFKGLYSYLKLIAEANSLNEFDARVVEAYWLGNSLLENVQLSDVKKLIMEDFKMLPPSIRKEKAAFLRDKAFVHHSFHVLFIQFLTKKLAPILKNLDSCIIKWGKLLERKKDKLKVKSIALMYEASQLKLIEKRMLINNNQFIEEPKKGMLLSIHWNHAIEEIDASQLKALKKYTLANLKLVNAYSKWKATF